MKIVKVLLSLSLVVLFACNTQSQNSSLIAVDKFADVLANTPDIQLLDVRTPEEYAGGYIEKAVNLNYNDGSFTKALPTLDKTKPVAVYCLAGGRSAAAADELVKAGFTKVYDLKNGFRAWKNANKPIAGYTAPAPVATTAAATTAASGNNYKDLTKSEFLKIVAENKFTVVDFNAKWCGPCKKMSPILDAIQKEEGDKVAIMKIDSDLNPGLSNEYGIEGLPTLLFFKGKNLIGTKIGFEGEAKLRALIAEFAEKAK